MAKDSSLNRNHDAEEDEIDLLEIGQYLLSHALVIILVMVAGAVILYCVSKFALTPKYTSDVKVYVNNSNAQNSSSYSISTTELSAAKTLVDTYVVILKMRPTLESVIEATGVNYTTEELKGMISAEAVNATEIFDIAVTSPYPAEAQLIANAFADVLPERISEVVDGSSVKIVERAEYPMEPSSPNTMKNTLIGAMAAFVLACGVYIIRYLTDTIIHDENRLHDRFDIPVLAVIPDLTEQTKASYK